MTIDFLCVKIILEQEDAWRRLRRMCWFKYLRIMLNGIGRLSSVSTAKFAVVQEMKIVRVSIRNFDISEIYILVK